MRVHTGFRVMGTGIKVTVVQSGRTCTTNVTIDGDGEDEVEIIPVQSEGVCTSCIERKRGIKAKDERVYEDE